jgi:hypothetical protein
MSWARAAYRSRQFFGALRARLEEEERAEVAAHLTPAEQHLFYSMDLRDQRHAFDVFRILKSGGQRDASLLAAALLHDVGKGPIRLRERVAFVLLRAVSPRLLRRLASVDGAPAGGGQTAARLGGSAFGGGWRGALARSLDHAERGAALAEAAGSTAETVRLIRLHRSPASASSAEPPGDDVALALLQAADESS